MQKYSTLIEWQRHALFWFYLEPLWHECTITEIVYRSLLQTRTLQTERVKNQGPVGFGIKIGEIDL